MSQPDLFVAPAPPVKRRPPDLARVRKSLLLRLRMAQNAEVLPWSEADTKSWEEFFPQLADLLPAEEAETLKAAFKQEIARIRAADRR